MQSPQLTKQTHSLHETSKKPKFKFLQRNLIFTRDNLRILKKANLKGLYIRKLVEEEPEENEEQTLSQASSRPYIRSKLWKGLRHLQIASLQDPYWQETLKRSKSLSSIKINLQDQFAILHLIPRFIKRLPKETKYLKINILKYEDECKYILRIPRMLSYLRNLRFFKRNINFDSEEEYVARELELYKKHTSRLKNLKRLTYDQSPKEQLGLQKFMEGNVENSAVTGLKIYLRLWRFENPYRIDTLYQDYEEENYDANDSEFLDETFAPVEQEAMNDQLSPFYQFHLFPKLQKLQLMLEEDAIYPLGPFVLEGFQSLKSLKELTIDLEKRPLRAKYFFQALAHLPLLKSFTFLIDRLEMEEWELLTIFLQTQEELETFRFFIHDHNHTKEEYLQQSQCLEDLIKAFDNRKALKNLDLQSDYWPLEGLSNALKHLNIPNQLRSLKLRASDDTINAAGKSQRARVEGLCEFLRSQKKSLKEMHIKLALVLEANVVNYVMEAVSELTELKSLCLQVNKGLRGKLPGLIYFYEGVLQVGTQAKKKLKRSKTWNPNVAKVLMNLRNLEDLQINFDGEDPKDTEAIEWFLAIMKIIPSLERLRTLTIWTGSHEVIKAVEEQLAGLLIEMRNLRQVMINIPDDEEEFEVLQETLETVNSRQSQRTDLMF